MSHMSACTGCGWGQWVPMPMVVYLEKVLTVRHTTDLQLAGQSHPCLCQASFGQPMQNEALIAIHIGLASMKNGLC